MKTNLISYFVWAISHLGSFILILLTAAGIGNPFLRRINFHSRLERVVYTLALGLGLSSLILFLLGLVGLLYREVIIAATVIGSLAAIIPFIRLHHGRWIESLHRWKENCRPRSKFETFALLMGIGYWLLLLLTVFAPTRLSP